MRAKPHTGRETRSGPRRSKSSQRRQAQRSRTLLNAAFRALQRVNPRNLSRVVSRIPHPPRRPPCKREEATKYDHGGDGHEVSGDGPVQPGGLRGDGQGLGREGRAGDVRLHGQDQRRSRRIGRAGHSQSPRPPWPTTAQQKWRRVRGGHGGGGGRGRLRRGVGQDPVRVRDGFAPGGSAAVSPRCSSRSWACSRPAPTPCPRRSWCSCSMSCASMIISPDRTVLGIPRSRRGPRTVQPAPRPGRGTRNCLIGQRGRTAIPPGCLLLLLLTPFGRQGRGHRRSPGRRRPPGSR